MKKILIDFIPTPIGDLISAVPYFDKYREKNNCDLFISIANIDLSFLFVTTYPLLKIV